MNTPSLTYVPLMQAQQRELDLIFYVPKITEQESMRFSGQSTLLAIGLSNTETG